MSKAAPKKYQKLPGRGRERGIISSGGLKRGYLAEDHLLCVEKRYFVESYKRFYYRDIEAIVVAQLSYLRAIFITGLVLLGICVVMAIMVPDQGVSLFFAVVSGIIGLFILIDMMRGRPCIAILRTAVQSEDLSFMGRMPTARKCLKQLVPLIEAAQTPPGQVSDVATAETPANPFTVDPINP